MFQFSPNGQDLREQFNKKKKEKKRKETMIQILEVQASPNTAVSLQGHEVTIYDIGGQN